MPVLQLGEQLFIYYLDDNPIGKPAVLLIHGLGVTGESWGFQLPELIGAGYRAIAPDLRGFGKSNYPGGDNRIEDLTEDMACLLSYLDAAPAHVVGISLGGAIALQLAIDHAHLVDKLVLINTFARLRPPHLTTWLFYIARGMLISSLGMSTQGRLVGRRMFPGDDLAWLRQQFLWQLSQSNPQAYRSTVHSIIRFDVTDRLEEIRAPTLVVTGALDATVTPEVQQRLVGRIPKAQQVIVPEGRHAMTVVQTELINQILLEYLSDKHIKIG